MLGLNSADKSERFLGVVTLAVLGTALLVVIALPSAGLAVGEDIRGNLAYALMIASVLVDVSVVLTYASTAAIQRVACVAWSVLALGILALALYIISLNDPEAFKAADTVLIVTMSILTFPASLLSYGVAFIYSVLLTGNRETSAVDLLAYWALFAVAGYMQWFWLIPRVLRKKPA